MTAPFSSMAVTVFWCLGHKFSWHLGFKNCLISLVDYQDSYLSQLFFQALQRRFFKYFKLSFNFLLIYIIFYLYHVLLLIPWRQQAYTSSSPLKFVAFVSSTYYVHLAFVGYKGRIYYSLSCYLISLFCATSRIWVSTYFAVLVYHSLI